MGGHVKCPVSPMVKQESDTGRVEEGEGGAEERSLKGRQEEKR